MKPKVFVSGEIPEAGIKLLQKTCDVSISKKNRVLTKKELIAGIKGRDALLCQLTNKIDMSVLKPTA